MKKVWYVDCQDLSCCWTTKKGALDYFLGEAKKGDWKYKVVTVEESLDPNNDYYVEFEMKGWCNNRVLIIPLPLDSKPYWD